MSAAQTENYQEEERQAVNGMYNACDAMAFRRTDLKLLMPKWSDAIQKLAEINGERALTIGSQHIHWVATNGNSDETKKMFEIWLTVFDNEGRKDPTGTSVIADGAIITIGHYFREAVDTIRERQANLLIPSSPVITHRQFNPKHQPT